MHLRASARVWFRTVAHLILILPLFMSTGCSVWMATHQEPHHDLNVLKPGHSRSQVLAELGQPMNSETRGGQRVDIFAFTQGQDGVFNVGRAVGHGAADVFTFGLWEVVGTPTEMILKGDKLAYEVTYDANEIVLKSLPINKNAPASPPPTNAAAPPANVASARVAPTAPRSAAAVPVANATYPPAPPSSNAPTQRR
jgi:outer membrane protein assembly factor BamE (lipoprotein component of BamABCDE complex)